MTMAIFIAAIFLIRPYFLQSRGMWYVGDDYDYFAHSSAIVFGQYPCYKKEFYTIAKEGPQSPIGPGILASPFVFVFSLLDRAQASTIVAARTQDNIVGSWSQFGFQVASVFYFIFACYLLFFGISRFVPSSSASTAVILMMVCQGLPLFVYRRPFFSHCSEFFIQSALMYFFLEFMAGKLHADAGQKDRKDATKLITGVCAFSGLLYLTRPNDIGYALIWPLLVMDYSKGIIPLMLESRTGILLFAGLMLIFKFWPETVNHMHPYAWAGGYLGFHMTIGDLGRRIVHILIGTDWGLIFTAPFFLISFVGLFFLKRLSKRFRWLLVPMAVNLYVIIAWGSQGGWYGYRYLIVSAIPVMTLPLAFLLEWISKKIRGWGVILIMLMALPPVLSMIAFETHDYFNLQIFPVDFHRSDWTNPDLQVNIWSCLIHFPGSFCLLVFQGLLALVYSARGMAPPLTQVTWVRVLIILFLPWLMWGGSSIISNLICIFRRKIIK